AGVGICIIWRRVPEVLVKDPADGRSEIGFFVNGINYRRVTLQFHSFAVAVQIEAGNCFLLVGFPAGLFINDGGQGINLVSRQSALFFFLNPFGCPEVFVLVIKFLKEFVRFHGPEKLVGIDEEVFLEVLGIPVAFLNSNFIKFGNEFQGIDLGFSGYTTNHLVNIAKIANPKRVLSLVSGFNHVYKVRVTGSVLHAVPSGVEEAVHAFVFGYIHKSFPVFKVWSYGIQDLVKIGTGRDMEVTFFGYIIGEVFIVETDAEEASYDYNGDN